MRRLHKLSMLLRAVLRRPRVESELDAELAEHLELEIENLIAQGVEPAEARTRALTAMGRLDIVKEQCRDARGTARWEQFRQDVFFGARLLARNRTYSLIALVTMALGIGSTTAVFSLVDGILLRPLPFAASDRLFYAHEVGMRGPFDTLRANSRLADYAAYLGVRAFNTPGPERMDRVQGVDVSANFFDVLGVPPLHGRTFVEGEDRPGRLRVAVLSHDYWVLQHSARPDIVGRQLKLDGVPYEIVGVMPAGFHHPSPVANFWIPMRLDPRQIGEYWGQGGVAAFARLCDGATSESAEAEFRAWIPRIRAMFPWRMPDAWGSGARFTGLQHYLVASARLRTLLLLGIVSLVLLIAIVNVANLMIGQTAARQRELTLRASLGATPARLARQLLTEAAVLAVAGGLLGTLLAFAQLAVLKSLLPADTPRLADVALDGRVLAFTAAISLASGLLFGLLPAWKQRTITGIETSRATRAENRTDAVLVTAEAAFATILLVGAGLLLHTLWTMLHVDPGFQVDSIVTAELSPGPPAYEQVRLKLAAYPGVSNVAAMNVLPLTPLVSAFSAAIEDHPRPAQAPQFSLWSVAVTPEHLETLDIALLQGRRFTIPDRRGAPPVVLISRSTAQRYWPDGNAVGRRLKPVWETEWRTIIGVVEDVKNYSMAGPPAWSDGEVYLPLPQALAPPQELSLAIRLSGDSAAFEKRLPAMIAEVCSACAVSKIARMENVVANATEAPRSTALLVASFALLALGLAVAGIYGVVSHGVVRRTRELGIRLALGASRPHVAWSVMGSSLRYTLAGSLLGLGASLALARFIRSLLYGVAPHDLLSFTVAPVVIVAAAALATLFPVWRAIRVDPAQSLREG